MNKDNSEIKKILEAGINNHEKNQLFEASKYYLEILELEKDNFEANFYLGIIYAQQKKFSDAEKQFIKSKKIWLVQ